jgi:16S rRNA (cytidine1402-2'-O)-methyltransferase
MKTPRTDPGELYVVATPIGNLEDISPRAVKTLSTVDVIAAEDTRHTSILLRHLAVNVDVVSLHEHNEERRAPELLARLLAGQNVALVSDAGTPLVSDPGYRLLVLVREAGIRVIPVPGACAVVAALSVCALPVARFTFEGFLPATGAARRAALSALALETRTMVFFESPRRVIASLTDMVRLFGEHRPASVCRELTKRFETVTTATLGDLLRQVEANPDQQRGEFVLVVQGHAGDPATALRPEWVEAVRELHEVMPLKRAARIIAGVTGARSQLLYRLAGSGDPESPAPLDT